MARYKMVCPHCGGDDVSADATVRWDIDNQTWGISGILDGGHCGACDTELKLVVEQVIGSNELPPPPSEVILNTEVPQQDETPFSADQMVIMQEDLGLPGGALDDKYNPEGDGEHPVITRRMWRDAVAQHDTISGYWDWTANEIAVETAPKN